MINDLQPTIGLMSRANKEERAQLLLDDVQKLLSGSSFTIPKAANTDGTSSPNHFLNSPENYHHLWRCKHDNLAYRKRDGMQCVKPWGYWLNYGGILMTEIMRGVSLIEDEKVWDALREHQLAFHDAYFFFGKAHGPGMLDGNALFLAVPFNEPSMEDFTLVFQVNLYYFGVSIILVNERAKKLLLQENMPWDTHWDSERKQKYGVIHVHEDDFPRYGSMGWIKHPTLKDKVVTHNFFDVLANYRLIQSFYGIPHLGSRIQPTWPFDTNPG